MTHISESVRENGFAVSRGLIPLEKVAVIRDRALACLQRPEAAETGSCAPRHWSPEFYRCADCFAHILQELLGNWTNQLRDSISLVAARKAPGISDGIGWHTDGMYFSDEGLAITAWIALENCGVDRPGLKMAKADRAAVQSYLGYDQSAAAVENPNLPPNAYRYHEDLCARLEAAETSFEIENPIYAAGDVVFMTNWCLHATHRVPAMTKPRVTMQVRFLPA